MVRGSNPRMGAICRHRLLARILGSQPSGAGSKPAGGSSVHVSPSVTNRDKGNWKEDAGSNPAMHANITG